MVNGALGTVDVLSLTDPTAPTQAGTLTLATGESANSVAVRNGIVAVAVQAAVKTDAGRVAFYNAATLALITSVAAGAQPDMLIFSPDGKIVLVANEGEPSSYNQADSVDPEGSVSLIDVSADSKTAWSRCRRTTRWPSSTSPRWRQASARRPTLSSGWSVWAA